MLKIKGTLLLMLVAYAGAAQAAWYVSSPDVTQPRIAISDEDYQFKMDNLNCGVTKTDFIRAPKDQLLESRKLYCWVGETYVYVNGKCALPYFEFSTLGITTKSKRYVPALICGPEQ